MSARFEPLSGEVRERARAASAWLAAHPGCAPEGSARDAIRDLARCIDQTLLAPDALPRQIVELCAGARAAGFAAVCVSPIHVALAARELRGSPVAVATVIGFPSGAHSPTVKSFEAARAIEDGAGELDMVLPIGMLRAGCDREVLEDVAGVVAAAGPRIVKVILETAMLTDEEKVRGVRLCRQAGSAMVKTSTGFGPGGATEADVALLRREAGASMGVKAAGGIRSADATLRMIAAGADRIGTSSGINILSSAHY